MAERTKKRRVENEEKTESTLQDRLLGILSGLPTIMPLIDALKRVPIALMRSPAVAPKNITSIRLVDGLEYASKGSDPKIAFEGSILIGKTYEEIAIRHYMQAYGYDFAVRFKDGYLLYRKFKSSSSHAYDGRVCLKLVEDDQDKLLVSLFSSVAERIADNCSMSMFNAVISSMATAMSLSAGDKTIVVGSLTDMPSEVGQRLPYLHKCVSESPAGRGLRRVMSQVLGLFLAGEEFENILSACSHLEQDELYQMLIHCTTFGIPIAHKESVTLVNFTGNEAECDSLRNVHDDALVHCAPSYVHANAIRTIKLDTNVYVEPSQLFRVKQRKGKTKERGNEIATIRIKASLLKIIAARNVLAPPASTAQDEATPANIEAMPEIDPLA